MRVQSVRVLGVLLIVCLTVALLGVVVAAAGDPRRSGIGRRAGRGPDALTRARQRPDLNFPEDDSKEDLEHYR